MFIINLIRFCLLKFGYIDVVRVLLVVGFDLIIFNSEGVIVFDYCIDKVILGVYNEELL